MARLALALILSGFFLPRLALGEPCPAPVWAPALADVDSNLRLQFLAATFDREVHDVDVWSWSWGSIYAGAMVGQLSALPFVHDGVRTDLAVGAVAAGVGAASLYLLPLRITRPLVHAHERWNDPDRCAVLADAESTLVQTAEIQRLSTGWIPHVGNVAVNAALALVLGWGYGRWTSAAISAAIGVAVGELNVLTQPHHLSEALERYSRAQIDGTPQGLRWRIVPVVSRGFFGATLEVRD